MTRPEFSKARVALSALDFLLPMGLIGLWLFLFAVNLKQQPLLPLGDPKLEEAISTNEH